MTFEAGDTPDPDTPLPHVGDLFGPSYDLPFYPSNILEISTVPHTARIRECQKELGMWANGGDPQTQNTIGFLGLIPHQSSGTFYPFLGSNYRTGFTQATIQNTYYEPSPQVYGIVGTQDFGGGRENTMSKSYLDIAHRVAYIDVTGSGDPFDPSNRLFLSLNFYNVSNLEQSPWGLDSEYKGEYYRLTDQRLVIKFSATDQCSCPLYAADFGSPFSKTSEDFIIEPTKWCPYAKDSPAVPVWNADTGERL